LNQKKGKNNQIIPRINKGKKAQVFLLAAIIATVYVITIALTIHQLQIRPVDGTHEELQTLSHVYENIKQELHTAMTMLLAAYTKNEADLSQLRQIFETTTLSSIERYCEHNEISAQLQPTQPLTIHNGSQRSNGLVTSHTNISTQIDMILQTEHIKLEEERRFQITYITEIRSAPPEFRVDLWTTTEQNVREPVEQATVQLVNGEALERIELETFHNGTYYVHSTIKPGRIEIFFETGVFFEIVFP